MSWEDQGRQEHGWFGNGTAPPKPKDGTSGATSTNTSRGDLAAALAYGAIASMPAAQRARAEAALQGRNLAAFREAMLAWMRGTAMRPETFAGLFFGRSADDPVVQALRDSVKLAMTSATPADMAEASGKVAEAMQRVGLDRWSRFIADAQTRASDPATEAAIKASIRAPDAIKPVYPVEFLLGAGIRSAGGLLRAGADALARQLTPEDRPTDAPPVTADAKPGDTGAPGSPVQTQGNGQGAGGITGAVSDIDNVLQETAQRSGDVTSAHKLSQTDALDAGMRFLGPGYREIGKPGSGVFRSADGLRQFRIDDGSLAGTHPPGVPHVHFEMYATPGNRIPVVNNHVPVVP